MRSMSEVGDGAMACALVAVLAGCGLGPRPTCHAPDVALREEPLKAVARARGLTFGSQFDPRHLAADASYEALLLREVDLVIPGNDFKMRHVHPGESSYDFSSTDAILDYADAHGLEVHGHTLVWGKSSSLPGWVRDRSWTRGELIAMLEDHVRTVVGRYRGRVAAWDVVNEAFCDPAVERACVVVPGESGGMDGSLWHTVIGPDFIEIALRAAREADPDAKIYVNDNGYELHDSPKAQKLYAYVEDLVERGVPLDGVGIQMHWGLDDVDTSAFDAAFFEEGKRSMATLFQRLNDLGLDVRITELDFRIPEAGFDSEEVLALQADAFALAASVCLEAESCPSLNLWGLTDKYSWIPEARPGYGCATLFDADLRPKPAYAALWDALSGE